MATKTTTWTISTWSNRASAEFVPITQAIGDVAIDAFGRKFGDHRYNAPDLRRAYKSEVDGNTAYVMYDDDASGPVPIIKVVEA